MPEVNALEEIQKMLGTVVTVSIENVPTEVQLVDGEVAFNQLGMSAGFVHFADPYYTEICLGFGGVSAVYNEVISHDR